MISDAFRNLSWKLNWFRQSELEGALLLGRMVGTVDDPDLIQRLTRHCAEEAEHSRLWADAIAQLDLPAIRIFRSYQSFYLRYAGPPARCWKCCASRRSSSAGCIGGSTRSWPGPICRSPRGGPLRK